MANPDDLTALQGVLPIDFIIKPKNDPERLVKSVFEGLAFDSEWTRTMAVVLRVDSKIAGYAALSIVPKKNFVHDLYLQVDERENYRFIDFAQINDSVDFVIERRMRMVLESYRRVGLGKVLSKIITEFISGLEKPPESNLVLRGSPNGLLLVNLLMKVKEDLQAGEALTLETLATKLLLAREYLLKNEKNHFILDKLKKLPGDIPGFKGLVQKLGSAHPSAISTMDLLIRDGFEPLGSIYSLSGGQLYTKPL